MYTCRQRTSTHAREFARDCPFPMQSGSLDKDDRSRNKQQKYKYSLRTSAYKQVERESARCGEIPLHVGTKTISTCHLWTRTTKIQTEAHQTATHESTSASKEFTYLQTMLRESPQELHLSDHMTMWFKQLWCPFAERTAKSLGEGPFLAKLHTAKKDSTTPSRTQRIS